MDVSRMRVRDSGDSNLHRVRGLRMGTNARTPAEKWPDTILTFVADLLAPNKPAGVDCRYRSPAHLSPLAR